MRVQIPAYTDRWMMGDQYGTVIKIVKSKVVSKPGQIPAEIASVLLDKSGKTVKVILDAPWAGKDEDPPVLLAVIQMKGGRPPVLELDVHLDLDRLIAPQSGHSKLQIPERLGRQSTGDQQPTCQSYLHYLCVHDFFALRMLADFVVDCLISQV